MKTTNSECASVREAIRERHAAGGVATALPPTLQRHLGACAACATLAREYGQYAGLLERTLGARRVSEGFDSRATRRLEQRREAAEAPETSVKAITAVHLGLTAEDLAREEAQARRPSALLERLGAAPWWAVSVALHALIVVLLGLITMTIGVREDADGIIVLTSLEKSVLAKLPEETRPEAKLRDLLNVKHETPATAQEATAASNVLVPPEILAQAELGDHFETINLDRPDTHSAFGNPEARMFHGASGNDEPEGGGGMGGASLLDDLIGVGGASSPGTGGGWGGGNGTGIGIGNGSGKGSFGARNGGGRKLMVLRHGGSKATESAVDKGLNWLARHQEKDGHWDTQKYGITASPWGDPLGKPDTALTSLALLAFLGAGHTERIGQYKDNVQRAVAWLIDKQQPNGLVFEKSDKETIGNNVGYTAAIATMALAEAASMAKIKSTREAAQKAVNYCTEIHQNGEGSEKHAWRYAPKASTEDLSVSGWFVMALKSAKVAGLQVNPASFEGAMKLLDKYEVKHPADAAGLDTGYGPPSEYGYGGDHAPGTALSACTSAIGVLCRQFMGVKKEELQSSVELFVKKGYVPTHDPRFGAVNLYYWYYGTLCVFQQGGESWNKWNAGLQAELLPTQCKDGDDSGSWAPSGSYAWAWGRVGQTALSTLCLEVYYRYLPMYR